MKAYKWNDVALGLDMEHRVGSRQRLRGSAEGKGFWNFRGFWKRQRWTKAEPEFRSEYLRDIG